MNFQLQPITFHSHFVPGLLRRTGNEIDFKWVVIDNPNSFGALRVRIRIFQSLSSVLNETLYQITQ